jgi:hypothetical protein
VAVRKRLVNLLLARYIFAAKVVFRYCWQAGKLVGITGLAHRDHVFFLSHHPFPRSQPGPFFCALTSLVRWDTYFSLVVVVRLGHGRAGHRTRSSSLNGHEEPASPALIFGLAPELWGFCNGEGWASRQPVRDEWMKAPRHLLCCWRASSSGLG